MSQYYSTERIKCVDFLHKHKKICYKFSSVRFKQLEDLAHPLKHLYPHLPLTPSTYLCQHCYNPALELVSSTDNEFITDNEVTDNVVDRDEDFLPSTTERIEEFNNEIITSFLGSVSPLKRKNLIHEKSIENYVIKKKKNILSTLSTTLDVKLNNVYDVSITANESTVCHCTEWIQNLGLALQKLSEKIKILTMLPSSFTKHEILSLLPEITMYMINKSRNLVKEK